MRTGAQLYTVRAYTQNEKDFAFTIKKIADMGYKTVQKSAIGRDIKPERVREICEKEGLEIVHTHSFTIRTVLSKSIISWAASISG